MDGAYTTTWVTSAQAHTRGTFFGGLHQERRFCVNLGDGQTCTIAEGKGSINLAARGATLAASSMRGFRAMIALSNVLHVGAFLLPISSVPRGNTAPKSTFLPSPVGTPDPAALRRRLTLSAGSNDEGIVASPAVLPPSGKPVLSFPGGGIFFWWQAGVISALQERYNLSSLDFVGASAGSLAATLAACDADMDLAMKLALDLCDTNEIWTRPLGLAGVWGAMVEDWLDELLPDDADVICRDRVHLLVIGIWPRPFRRRAVSDFTNKSDLIKACMASVHIPWFMDKHFSARHRGGRFVDGSFRASREDLSLGDDRPTVYFDYDEDEVMAARRGKFLSLTNKDGLLFMRQRGYDHVQTMLAEGKLDCIEEAALPLQKKTTGGLTGKD